MFLIWLFITIAIGVGEQIKLSWDAYKHPYKPPECFREFHNRK